MRNTSFQTKTLLLIVALLLGFSFFAYSLPAEEMNTPKAPSDYPQTVITGGAVEATYLAMGEHQVSSFTRPGSAISKTFYVYYPEELSEEKYPVVVMLNGTGVYAHRYEIVFQHLASWGFIVIGSDDISSGFGVSADESVDLIQEENANPESPLYGRFDMENIGIVGHSQGGAGVLTALSVRNHRDCYKTAVALSPTYEEFSYDLGWRYDLASINTPILVLAGTKGDFETKLVIPFEKMLQLYGKFPSMKMMARRIEAEHGQMLYMADGYVTAWLMWQLKGDEYAAKAFVGEDAELLGNELYCDQAADLNPNRVNSLT